VHLWVGEESEKMLFKQITEDKRGRKYVVDEHLKICSKCGRAWENVNKRIYHIAHIIYPLGAIPAIGKKKIPCPQCIGT